MNRLRVAGIDPDLQPIRFRWLAGVALRGSVLSRHFRRDTDATLVPGESNAAERSLIVKGVRTGEEML